MPKKAPVKNFIFDHLHEVKEKGLNAESVVREAGDRGQTLNLSTVYNTLSRYKRLGYVVRVRIGREYKYVLPQYAAS